MAWQAEQPTFENTCDPAVIDALDGVVEVVPAAAPRAVGPLAATVTGPVAGVGAASILMNKAKLTMSDEKPEAGLAPLVPSVKLVALSGWLLNWQLGSVSRSLGKLSLVTPCSTL